MMMRMDRMGRAWGMAALTAFVGVFAVSVGGPVQPASADETKKPQNAWVKLCEKANIRSDGTDGKPVDKTTDICLTHHERLDANTGMVIVSAALREVEGAKTKSLMIMVPLGMALPPGVRAAVYTPEQWKQAEDKEKIDETKLKPLSLRYSLCHPAGCTAEIEATEEMVESMKSGGGMMVLAVNQAGLPIGFPIPLTGFTKAYTGKPVDNKKYAEARGQLMQRIRETRIERAKAAEAQAATQRGVNRTLQAIERANKQ